jgi:hypothetical protein
MYGAAVKGAFEELIMSREQSPSIKNDDIASFQSDPHNNEM